jgi:malonyl-CoA/methylmalonyl-CoA synthetase
MSANLYSVMRERFAREPGRVALEMPEGGELSYGALDDLSARMAAVLAARGVSPGDRVVAQVEKSPGAVALYLGCLRSGAVFVPLNTAYTDAELATFLADAEPRVFVRSASGEAGGRQAEVLGTDAASPLWAEALATAPRTQVEHRSATDLAAIVYTSGTTGRSKGAMLSHGNLASNARTLAKIWGFGERDVLLHALPIYHVHGLFVALHCAFLSGARVLFLPKFDVSEVKALLPRASVLMGVPTFYSRLLADEGFGKHDCRSMRLFVSGSAPLLAETWRAFERRTGHAILERYGMTETGMITSNPLAGERVAGTVGFALPDVEIRLANEDGSTVEPGSSGVLEVKGPNVFAGYWRMPERDSTDRRADGFFVTGDIATMDDEGRVTLVGRAKDLIITGGLNVYPKEIEEVLDACDGVRESAVVGVPDADFGEAIVAIVVPDAGAQVDAGRLMDAVRAKLARFKHPRRIEFAGELPRNAMGKVQKNVLRERLKKSGTGTN